MTAGTETIFLPCCLADGKRTCADFRIMPPQYFFCLQMKTCGRKFLSRIRLGSVTLEQYILFHAARDVYLGTKHIRLSELTDRELIPDEILRLIVNAFVMERYGVDIVEQEVWNED